MKTLVIASFAFTGAFSTSLLASQPLDSKDKSTIAAYEKLAMSETDMDDVSAISGLNVLAIHGSPAGGLTHENDEGGEISGSSLNEWGFPEEAEDDGSQVVADQELKKTQDDSSSPVESDFSPQLNDESVVLGDSSIKGEAHAFVTSSEIQYQKDNFHHETTVHQGGAISISRNLHIDQLKIENLSGDHYDHNRSVGSIYLSDWRSLGDTTVTPR